MIEERGWPSGARPRGGAHRTQQPAEGSGAEAGDAYEEPGDESDVSFDQGDQPVLGRLEGGRGGGALVARLREGAADRLPPAMQQRPGVPRAAAIAALVIALVLTAALVSRARGQDGAEITVPGDPIVTAAAGVRAGHTGAAWGGRAVASSGGAVSFPAVPGSAIRTALPSGGDVGVAATGAPAMSGAEVVVDVTGRVRHAGLVRLPAGSRVWDAVVAAGGPVTGARLDRLNLARRLGDGEQVMIPGPNDPVPPDPVPPSGSGGGPTGGSPAEPLDLNAATAEQLDTLPGVGPVLARRILDWRAQHSRFSRVEELGEVSGIGDKLFAQLRARVRV